MYKPVSPFAGLRSILRLDPNVILVGEIRDAETANRHPGGFDGHLMLSSIHANDAATTVAVWSIWK